ncbi:MAG: Protein-glutamate methylesterase/protein-glutamine glutaminase [Pseudomonadota bacterium]|jgi:EAL domain-containing protein (putative c-di-GMP-specific phosphodiesterase class I)
MNPDQGSSAVARPALVERPGAGRVAWIVMGDLALARALATDLQERGWQIGLISARLGDVVDRLRAAPTAAPVPTPGGAGPAQLLISGLRLPDGDAFKLMRYLAAHAQAPALALVSWQQRAVIRAAQALADTYGVPLACTCELPAKVEHIVDAALAGVALCARRGARARASAPPLTHKELQALLDRTAVVPYFQPKMRLDSLEITGFEALMRAHDAAGGLITPDRLIGPLVEHGLLGVATLQVARATIDFVVSCLMDGLAIGASINVSLSLMSDPGFCAELVAMVEAAGVDPSWVTIEITETEAMADLATVIEHTARVRMYGFNLSIDDFGTAYSSFFQLSQIPFSELKVERAFIKDLHLSTTTRAIVGTCAHLGRALGLGVVAEGVETAAQLQAVTEAGYTAAQGYLIARPMPAAVALDWLRGLDGQRYAPAPALALAGHTTSAA